MSIIIDNYETITRTLVHNIRSGQLVSKNSDRLGDLNTVELFNLFSKEFDLTFIDSTVSVSLFDTDLNIIGVPIIDAVYIQHLYFKGIGEVELPSDITLSVNDGVLYFDLTTLNIPIKYFGPHSVVDVSYVRYKDKL